MGRLLIVEKKSTCPNCGSLSERLHQNYRYLVRDLPMMQQDVYLRVNRRQFKCDHEVPASQIAQRLLKADHAVLPSADRCQKPFCEELNFVKKTRTYTERLAQKVITEVVESDLQNVAQRNGLSEKEVETILKEKFAEFKTDKPRGLKKLGIDEIAWVKGHKNYCAVLVDLETRRPVDILEKSAPPAPRSPRRKDGASKNSGMLA